MKQFYPVTPELAETLRQGKLTAAEWRIWSYLITIDPWGNQYKDVDTLTVMSVCEVSKATYYRAIAKFVEIGFLPKEFISQYTNIEQQIRDRLQTELGGQCEIFTAVGRIDLLTEDQIIEIKGFNDWKNALGQILAYSAFFPTHQKRIHLFGTAKQISRLADIEASCLAFNVLVTGEIKEINEGVKISQTIS